jgi:hypothetical protein
MIGDRLHRIARRVLSTETCRTILEAAIADLQHEAARGQTWRVRGYIGVCRAFAAALSIDVVTETSRAISAMATAAAVRPAFATLAVVFLILSAPFVARAHEFHASLWVVLPLLLVSGIPLAILPALSVAARSAARSIDSTRGFAFAGLVAAALLLASIDQGITRTNWMFRQIEGGSCGIEQPVRGPRELSLTELWRDDAAARWPGGEKAFLREGARRIGLAASAIAYVLFGFALARLRMRTTAIVLLGIIAAHSGLMLFAGNVSAGHGLIVVATLSPHLAMIVAGAVVARRAVG